MGGGGGGEMFGKSLKVELPFSTLELCHKIIATFGKCIPFKYFEL